MSQVMCGKIRHFYEFSDFRLDAENPSLWLNDRLVSMPPKALELLTLLVRHHDTVVSREELLETVWRDTFVEEGNINYTVSLLRKALGEKAKGELQFIQTVPKRGYRFVADVREVIESEADKITAPNPIAGLPITKPPDVALTNEPTSQVRWHLLGIVFLGLFLLTSLAFWWKDAARRGLSGLSVAERNIGSLAILPLKTLGERERSEALSLGLADSLISRLGSLNRFAVRPLNAVKAYAGGDNDPLKFGEELKVDAVLEGTLQTIDNRLRLNMRLLDVRDGAQLWQGSFDETKTDIFRLQDTLSIQVTESLTSKLNRKERAILTKRDTENREAFHSYSRGRAFLEIRNIEKAIPEFQQAIRLDPHYALAYTGLADAYSAHALFTSSANAEFYNQARALAEKALTLDPHLSEAHTALGRVRYLHDWDWAGAEKSFRRAVELNPNNVKAHQFYSRLLATLERTQEALAAVHKARELDPRSADLAIPLSAILVKRGDFDEALKVVQASLEMDKDFRMAHRCVGIIYLLKGEYAKVIELGNQHFPNPKETDFAWASLMATAYHRVGQENKATQMRKHLTGLAATDSKALYYLALHFSELGRADEAFAALQKCFELREERMIWTKDEWRLAALRDDPRFREILQRMNLTN